MKKVRAKHKKWSDKKARRGNMPKYKMRAIEGTKGKTRYR